MQHEERASPYRVEILSSGLCNTEESIEVVTLRVAWVVEDSQTRPICYGYTDFDRQGNSLEKDVASVNHTYRLRAELAQKDVAEMLREVSKATRVEAKALRYRIACLYLELEGVGDYASYN